MKRDRQELKPLAREDIIPILKQIAIFGGFTAEQLAVVFCQLEKITVLADDIIFREGEEPSHIYIIESGKVKMVADLERIPFEIVTFGVGECFGEMSVVGIVPHSAAAIACVDTELIVMPRNALMELYHDNPKLFSMLILNIAREACRRLYKTDQVLLHYARHNAQD